MDEIKEPDIAPPKSANQVARTIDVNKALKLHLKGVTHADIAVLQGVSRQAISKRLSQFTRISSDPVGASAYREAEGELLDGARLKLLASLVNKADDKKASVNNLAYALRQTFDMTRLIRGESTSNLHSLTVAIDQASSELFKKKSNDNSKLTPDS